MIQKCIHIINTSCTNYTPKLFRQRHDNIKIGSQKKMYNNCPFFKYVQQSKTSLQPHGLQSLNQCTSNLLLSILSD